MNTMKKINATLLCVALFSGLTLFTKEEWNAPVNIKNNTDIEQTVVITAITETVNEQKNTTNYTYRKNNYRVAAHTTAHTSIDFDTKENACYSFCLGTFQEAENMANRFNQPIFKQLMLIKKDEGAIKVSINSTTENETTSTTTRIECQPIQK
jgi:hypothetical protein